MEEQAKTAQEILSMSILELGEWFRKNVTVKDYLDLTCIYCGGYAEQTDHVIPKSRGGTNKRENLVPSCVGCNATKGTQTPLEWLGVPNEEIFRGSSHHLDLAQKRFEAREK